MDAMPVDSYAHLVVALRSRLCEIGTTFAGVDQLAGLPDRYVQKLLGHEPVKRLGAISLFPILQALGLKLMLVSDPSALARLQDHALWVPLRRHGSRYRPVQNGRHGPAPKPRGNRRRSRPSNGAILSGRAEQTSV